MEGAESLRGLVLSSGKALADLAMPRTCLVCGNPLGTGEKHLCIWCEADVPLTYNWEQIHHSMADEFNAVLERLRRDNEPLEYAYAASLLFYHHENPYKAIPRDLKYHRNLPAGRFFAAQLGRYMAAVPHWADVDVVIPVPLHWLRKWRRGYNQAEVIARELARALGASLRADVLRRARRTRSQTSLSAEERLRNVASVFVVRKPVQARHVLLVDDTFTTGATLAACHRVLRDALGPSVRISIATLAVVEG